MAIKPRRRAPRRRKVATLHPEWFSGTAGDWLKRWEAAAPYAVDLYAQAIRGQAEAMITKYREALERRLKLKRGQLGQCRGA